ncbi:MAG: hypothetical protein SVU24_05115 [Pseudomonadota bacterium]|nr:hypothetical protein [Pseudomonadota bacterium]
MRSIVGDTKYGEGRHNRLFRERLNAHRLLLMAVGIEFQHPAPGQRMRIEAGGRSGAGGAVRAPRLDPETRSAPA